MHFDESEGEEIIFDKNNGRIHASSNYSFDTFVVITKAGNFIIFEGAEWDPKWELTLSASTKVGLVWHSIEIDTGRNPTISLRPLSLQDVDRIIGYNVGEAVG